jgi:Zn-dependent protease with chaperone function
MVDPFLKQAHQRLARHNWRILGSAVISVTALVFYQKTGLIPSIIGVTTLLIGLGWRIRAFLYVGTITFILTVLYQLVVLNFQYSFAKWVIGLALGILFILVAANFEQRREQIQRLWQNCLEELARWE